MSHPKILSKGWGGITPRDAGWTYVSFEVVVLAAGESCELPADGQERALVPLSGTVDVTAGDRSWQLGGRKTVFDGLGWCLYLPRDTTGPVDRDDRPRGRHRRRPGHHDARTGAGHPRRHRASSSAAVATPPARSTA